MLGCIRGFPVSRLWVNWKGCIRILATLEHILTPRHVAMNLSILFSNTMQTHADNNLSLITLSFKELNDHHCLREKTFRELDYVQIFFFVLCLTKNIYGYSEILNSISFR